MGNAFLPTIYIFVWADSFFMSRYRRADIPGGTYFFTVATYRRRPILCDEQVWAALRDAVKTVRLRPVSPAASGCLDFPRIDDRHTTRFIGCRVA